MLQASLLGKKLKGNDANNFELPENIDTNPNTALKSNLTKQEIELVYLFIITR